MHTMQVEEANFVRIEPDMQVSSGEGQNRSSMQFELLRTAAGVMALRGSVARLMLDSHHDVDASLTPAYFLASLESNERPRVVACYQYGELVGVLYASELCLLGIATGFLFGGDQMGRGLVLASVEREKIILTAACAFLLENGQHGMRLNWTPRLPLLPDELRLPQKSARLRCKLDVHPEGDWLRLEPTYEGFLARMGSHTRRNLRYYRRKVEALGFTYSGALGADELTGALRSLNQVADYPISQARLDRDRRFFAAFGTPVIAGLRDSGGNFISLVTGFISGRELHILTQLNGEGKELRKLSLSLVLRGYLIEDFIQRGFTSVHFIHGSSPMLGRFCEPVDLQVISIDDRRAIMTLFKKACSTLANAFRRRGRRIPYRLRQAAGSYLQ